MLHAVSECPTQDQAAVVCRIPGTPDLCLGPGDLVRAGFLHRTIRARAFACHDESN
jgi:hypothetical protein